MVKQDEYVVIEKVGQRGTLFSFYEEKMNDTTICYMINTPNYLFLFDTFVGPEAMQHVKNHLHTEGLDNKPMFIILTHSHWDHVWGNSAFPNATIIASHHCTREMKDKGEKNLQKFGQFQAGPVELVYPTLTFESNLSFPEEEIELYYTPGHSICSITGWDNQDKTLIVGDNVEFPFPYLFHDQLPSYISTLETYLAKNPKIIVPGHGKIQTNMDLLYSNIKYVQEVKDRAVDLSNGLEKYKLMNVYNMKFLAETARNRGHKDFALDYYKYGLKLLHSLTEEKDEEIEKEFESQISFLS